MFSDQRITVGNGIDCVWRCHVSRWISLFDDIHFFIGHANDVTVFLVGDANSLATVILEMSRIHTVRGENKTIKIM